MNITYTHTHTLKVEQKTTKKTQKNKRAGSLLTLVPLTKQKLPPHVTLFDVEHLFIYLFIYYY